jgi:hypothetical protein
MAPHPDPKALIDSLFTRENLEQNILLCDEQPGSPDLLFHARQWILSILAKAVYNEWNACTNVKRLQFKLFEFRQELVFIADAVTDPDYTIRPFEPLDSFFDLVRQWRDGILGDFPDYRKMSDLAEAAQAKCRDSLTFALLDEGIKWSVMEARFKKVEEEIAVMVGRRGYVYYPGGLLD